MKHKLIKAFRTIIFISIPVSMLVFSYNYKPHKTKPKKIKITYPQYDNKNKAPWKL